MLRFLLPLGIALAGLGAGVFTGTLTRPPDDPEADTAMAAPDPGPRDYVRLNNQFVVPVLADGRVESFVILSISLEVTPGGSTAVYAREARLRDAFLAALFEHANFGGFRGTFTAAEPLRALRAALLEAATAALGPVVTDVLIVDLVRQDA